MSVTRKFYSERAADARRDADTANLANVRDRHLRAAAAWEVMAARLARTERMRAETDARKAAEHAAEAALVAAGVEAEEEEHEVAAIL